MRSANQVPSSSINVLLRRPFSISAASLASSTSGDGGTSKGGGGGRRSRGGSKDDKKSGQLLCPKCGDPTTHVETFVPCKLDLLHLISVHCTWHYDSINSWRDILKATIPLMCRTWRGGGSEQKTQLGRAANMGSKISLVVYEWSLIKCRIWYVNGSVFQNFLKFEPKWLKFKKILEKSGDFGQNYLTQSWTEWYMNGSLFLEKLVFVWVYFQISRWHFPTTPCLSLLPLV